MKSPVISFSRHEYPTQIYMIHVYLSQIHIISEAGDLSYISPISHKKQILSSWSSRASNLQFPDSHPVKQIEKREEMALLFIKSTLLRYKFHEIKYSYLKFLGWLILANVYVCINTITIKILNTSIIFKTNTNWMLSV